jgi:hypothetical protein
MGLTIENSEERDALVNKIALLKRNAMAAPFEQAYQEHYALREEAAKFTSEEAPQGVREGGDIKAIHYREEEAIYIKVFIQEFVDARRRAIQNAPQVLFRNDPPLELQGVPGVKNSGTGDIGYVTFGKHREDYEQIGPKAYLHCISFVPSAPDASANGGCHLPYPDLPRLLPLPHQGFQGAYP